MTITFSDIDRDESLIDRLWRGDVSLAKTYWFYVIVLGNVIAFLCTAIRDIISYNTAYVSGSQYTLLMLSNLSVIGAARGFLFVALWRSATNYSIEKPTSGKPFLAKSVVCAGFAFMGLQFLANVQWAKEYRDAHRDTTPIETLSSTDVRSTQYQSPISAASAYATASSPDQNSPSRYTPPPFAPGYPFQIDQYSEVTARDIDENGITIYINFHNTMDDNAFLSKIYGQHLLRVCDDTEALKIMSEGKTARLQYRDPLNSDLYHFDVRKGGCEKP